MRFHTKSCSKRPKYERKNGKDFDAAVSSVNPGFTGLGPLMISKKRVQQPFARGPSPMTSKRDQTGAAAAAGGLSGSEFMLSTIPANHNKSLSNASSYASFRGEKQVRKGLGGGFNTKRKSASAEGRLNRNMRSQKVQLPTLPDVAVRRRREINKRKRKRGGNGRFDYLNSSSQLESLTMSNETSLGNMMNYF